MNLNLVWVLDKATGKKSYFGVNDKHFDGMLASGDIDGYEWGWEGLEVTISEEILYEEGYREYGG